MVVNDGWFWADLYNKPAQPNLDLGIHRLAAAFIIEAPTKTGMLRFCYELQVNHTGKVTITFRNKFQDSQPSDANRSKYCMHDLFSAIRDFPAPEYRKSHDQHDDHPDLYNIRLSFGERISAASFSYSAPVASENRAR